MTEYLFWFEHVDAEDREFEVLALHAVSYREHDWHGFHVPLATAAEYRRWLCAWQVNDPNGEWVNASLAEGDGALVVTWQGGDREVITVAGMSGGAPVYPISGYTWADPVVPETSTERKSGNE